MEHDGDALLREIVLAGLEDATWIRREAWARKDLAYGTRLEAVVGKGDAEVWFVPPEQVGAWAAPGALDDPEEWTWRAERLGDHGLQRAPIGAHVVARLAPEHWRPWVIDLTEAAVWHLRLLIAETDDVEYREYLKPAEERLSEELELATGQRPADDA